jgi:uncharacterized membrane protein
LRSRRRRKKNRSSDLAPDGEISLSSQASLASTAKRNIAAIAELEQQVLAQRSRAERIGGAIAEFFGSLRFILAEFFAVATWVVLNTRMVVGVSPFDLYPFPLLSLIVGIEFIFLTTFVLMNQKHEMRRAEQWSHLHLQISMLTEQEVTKNMQMLRSICQQLGLDKLTADQEASEMAENTAVSALADEIEKARELDGPA